MTHRERVLKTIERRPVDYPASWLGIPTKDALPGLFEYFGVNDLLGLKKKIDDDLFTVDIPYVSPNSNHVAFAFDFARQGQKDTSERTLTNPGFFAKVSRIEEIDSFPWPDPKKHIDPVDCLRRVEAVPQDYAVMVAAWSTHCDATSEAFGMENAMIKMMTEPDIYQGVMRRILDFYLEANEIFYRAVGDKIDVVLIGNDLGTQRGLLLGPAEICKYVLPGTKELVQQAHSHGYKVMHHSCGSIVNIIPDLIETGVDIIHPIQTLAAGMEPECLKNKFGNSVSFCGGVDAQNLLVNGAPSDVEENVKYLKELFPTGLIISPSHEAILKDIKQENIEALFKAVH
jgi:uroporphyrinogen decarboxylase